MKDINFKKYNIFKGKKIYVDGGDFAGKTTFQTKLRKFAIESDVFVNDRTWISSYVYAKYFKRDYCDLDIIKKRFHDDINSNKGIYVLLIPSEEEIKIRQNKRKEDFIDDKDIIGIHEEYLSFYEEYKEHYNLYLLQQERPENYFITRLHDLSKKYKNSQLKYDYDVLLNTLKKDCKIKEKDYSEIFNYKLTYHFNSLYDFNEKFGRGISLVLEDKNNKDEFNELYAKEEPEREMTLNQLKFNSQLNMEKFGDSIESRRFVSHNDSCISFLQFQIRKDAIYINVIWRSSEVSKMLPVDFKSLKYIIKEYINWFYKFGYILNNKIVLDIQLNNCHIYC